MIKQLRIPTFFFILLSVIACTSLQPGYEPPVVTISSFNAKPSESMVPQFEIGLHIINPSRQDLKLKGIVYTISLEGHKIITGVSNKLPVIEAYGEGDVLLTASVDIFHSIKFFADMIKNQNNKENLSYTLNTKLDLGGMHPMIRVTKKGTVSLLPSDYE